MTHQYRRRTDGAYPITPEQIRAAHKANVSFGPTITPDVADALGYDTVSVDTAPTYDPSTHVLQPVEPQIVGGQWVQGWQVIALPPATVAANQAAAAAQMQQAIVDAMTAHFDTVAQAKRYDNRITCALRAGYTGPFQAEGQAFATWMDECNQLGYQMLSEVHAGTRPMPATVDAALALLPAMVWP